MANNRTETGFTIVEVVIALVVISLLLTLFFQLFLASLSQQTAVVQRATANDVALSNLGKITSVALIPAATTDCTDPTGGSDGTSTNNLIDNPNAPGSIIATDDPNIASYPWGSGGRPSKQQTADTNLPDTGVIQELRVLYPQGCDVGKPVKIISTVDYGSERVTHATYIE